MEIVHTGCRQHQHEPAAATARWWERCACSGQAMHPLQSHPWSLTRDGGVSTAAVVLGTCWYRLSASPTPCVPVADAFAA